MNEKKDRVMTVGKERMTVSGFVPDKSDKSDMPFTSYEPLQDEVPGETMDVDEYNKVQNDVRHHSHRK